ncbi:MAG TPA: NUDIX hydrolase [Phenylobacterium sp.]|jgi:8-oxo-dGTP pyrophosphatase MutT (NUDIX family)|uniref:NUDIX hydrolase n=1 Tax=Phenylobacterium sp. TaxID=1871053 RepID=UPI002D369E52|nr:NUDIX hydrolase [Phenylobacterium sp.]HZZ68873.1 NUDIX hydrolase [Phenylobacterium sp.]
MAQKPSARPAWLRPHGDPWTPGAERVAFESGWITVTDQIAIAPTGRPAPYGLVRFKNLAVAVLPIHDDGTVVLVGQHRFPLGNYSWELPEGGAPLDEDPLDGAKRELAEETGLMAAQWREILRTQLSNSVTDERMVGYLALGLSEAPSGHAADETEVIALARVPFREALDAAMAGQLPDMLTVAMLLRGYHMAVEGALPGALARAMLG